MRSLPRSLTAFAPLLAIACAGPDRTPDVAGQTDTVATPTTVRVATFNIFELSVAKLDQRDAGGASANAQVRAAAELIQQVRPDILLLNELDAPPHDPALTARRFAMEVLNAGPQAIAYPYVYATPSNTGELSGFDLNRDDTVATTADLGTRRYGDDSWGYGTYPGQYGMALLSRFPLDTAGIRTFRLLPWQALPNAHLPEGWFADSMQSLVRLSSKSHWDVPVLVGSDTLHLLASHPTPPVFDGPEDRNGRRNFDEVGFWKHYLDGHAALRDDRGRSGGLPAGRAFVILGDLNAAPDATESWYDGQPAIRQLLAHARVRDVPQHTGRPTAQFSGDTRVDYVLPAAELVVRDGGVAWPDSTLDPVGAARAATASDHRLVWLDLALPLRPAPR